MSDNWEVASTIGTWAAVLLGILALGGLVGPLLIWRASQTERHQAIDKLDKGEAQSGGYISKGIRVSPTIRLFRRIQVPLLQQEPHLPGHTLAWRPPTTDVSQTSASWVQFCLAITAYRIHTSEGDSLVVRAGRTWLPVHKNWILILGIVGRFSNRPDLGKLPLSMKGRVRSVQASPGRAFRGHRKFDFDRGKTFQSNWRLRLRGTRRLTMIDDEEDRFKPLHGLCGTLWTRRGESSRDREPSKVYYTQHKITETGQLSENILTIGDLFWLSVGCLPGANGNIYCLENVEEVDVDEQKRQTTRDPSYVMEEREERTPRVPAYYAQMTNPQNVHFDANSDDADYPQTYSSSSLSSLTDESSSRNWRERRRRNVQGRRRTTSYVIPTTERKARSATAHRTFRFSPSSDHVDALSSVANSLEPPDASGTVFSLEEVDPPADSLGEFEESTISTYHPINGSWVRLGKDHGAQRNAEAVYKFLDRESAHTIAKALLDIPMSADGYLMPRNKLSLCRATLCNAAQYLPRLIGRMSDNLDNLFIHAETHDKTLALFDRFLSMCLDFKPDRAFFRVLYELDSALTKLLSPNTKANAAIGIIMLTNAEFRDIIAQSVRLIPQSKDKFVVLVLGQSSTLNIPSAMGVVQKFPFDQHILSPKVLTEEVQIKYHDLLFAALKACLRSALLETSLDSTPLFNAFLKMGEIVQMG